jgi:hypothetical protein
VFHLFRGAGALARVRSKTDLLDDAHREKVPQWSTFSCKLGAEARRALSGA